MVGTPEEDPVGEITSAAIHMTSRDRVALIDALNALCAAEGLEPIVGEEREDPPAGARRFLLLPPRGRWTMLLPENPEGVRKLAGDMARRAKTNALAVVLIDDAFAFAYDAFNEAGGVVDVYHSCPDAELAFGEEDVPDEELERSRGEPSKLSALGVDAEALTELSTVLADARIERLADHDVSGAIYDDAETPLRIFREKLKLSDAQEEGFDALWDLGLDEESEATLRYLVWAPPKTPGKLRSFWNSLRKEDDPADEPLDDEDLDDDEALDGELDGDA
jgi:hypothetical protein